MIQRPLIPEQQKAELKRAFRKELKGDVTLRLFTQRPSLLTIPGRECPTCPQAQQLMEELSALSPKLHLETVDFYERTREARDHGVTRIPAIVVGANGSARVKFYGNPLGQELAAFIEGIKSISRGVSPLAMETRKKLRRVNRPVHIQVFVTPTCPYSPALARLAHAFALESPHIAADVVEIQEFPALARVYVVRSVPLIVINEYTRLTGAIAEERLLDSVLHVGVPASPESDSGGER